MNTTISLRRISHACVLAVLTSLMMNATSANALELPAGDLFKKVPQFSRLQQAWSELGKQSQVFQFLTGKGPQYKMLAESVSPELSTLRFQHQLNGITVLGSQSLQHLSLKSGNKINWSHQIAQFDLNTVPSISAEAASGLAREATGGREIGATPRLLILPAWSDRAAKLIYRFEIQAVGDEAGRIVDIDGHSGKLLADVSRHWSIAPVDVYKTIPTCQTLESEADDLGGKAPISVDYKKCRRVIRGGVIGSGADVESRQALQNSNKVLNYYLNEHNRDSFDGQGAKVSNIVHIGEKWVNAFWDSENDIMAYGDGDGQIFKSLTLSEDVAGHEMTHGVVSKTANLEYQSESGALNEGFADYFGESIEGQNDWVMGANLFFDADQGKNGIRNLKDPHQTTYRSRDDQGHIVARPAPTAYSEIFKFEGQYCGGHNDNCGVHMNATLLGHAGYLMVEALGREKSDKIFYNALVHYLTETSDFKAFGKGVRQACQALYDAADCAQADTVLTQVGL